MILQQDSEPRPVGNIVFLHPLSFYELVIIMDSFRKSLLEQRLVFGCYPSGDDAGKETRILKTLASDFFIKNTVNSNIKSGIA